LFKMTRSPIGSTIWVENFPFSGYHQKKKNSRK
jgi:hypothetical protein